MPEGVIRLNATGVAILSLCDGARSLREIVIELRLKYPAAEAEKIEAEAMEFLDTLREKRVVDF